MGRTGYVSYHNSVGPTSRHSHGTYRVRKLSQLSRPYITPLSWDVQGTQAITTQSALHHATLMGRTGYVSYHNSVGPTSRHSQYVSYHNSVCPTSRHSHGTYRVRKLSQLSRPYITPLSWDIQGTYDSLPYITPLSWDIQGTYDSLPYITPLSWDIQGTYDSLPYITPLSWNIQGT